MSSIRNFILLAALSFTGFSGCAKNVLQKNLSEKSPLHNIVSIEEFDQLPYADKVRYFTDNVYLAATGEDGEAADRAEAAAAALDRLAETLDTEDFIAFWTGVDAEFFGRVNAVTPYDDYTRPQVSRDSRHVRTLYNLSPRHLKVLRNLKSVRSRTMADFVDLTAKGNSSACFAFHKAYSGYADPMAGEAVSWLDVDGTPFRKSIWEGSAEAMINGTAVQIPIPPQVVLGCRNIRNLSDRFSSGFVQDVESYFNQINLTKSSFDLDTYNRNKEQWLANLKNQALTLSEQMKTDKLIITNIVVIYQIFPPQEDHEFSVAAMEGRLTELVASNILSEQDAFIVEEKVHERRILLDGAPVTPTNTPMAFIQLLTERPVARRKK